MLIIQRYKKEASNAIDIGYALPAPLSFKSNRKRTESRAHTVLIVFLFSKAKVRLCKFVAMAIYELMTTVVIVDVIT